MEKFLAFWTLHNTTIIEVLVALILLTAVVIVYRLFFTKISATEEGLGGQAAGGAVNTEAIEKTLQKILETTHAARSVDSGVHSAASGPDAELIQQRVEELQKILNEKQQQIESLQQQVQSGASTTESNASAGATSTVGSGGGSAASNNNWAQEKSDLLKKIRDLEGRLSEYEIISEDIADLSKYKEENAKLVKEIEALKAGAAPVATAAAAPAAPAAAVPVATPETVAATPAASLDPAPPAAETAAPLPEANASVIDDDIMKEFAAAVDQQKSVTGSGGST